MARPSCRSGDTSSTTLPKLSIIKPGKSLRAVCGDMQISAVPTIRQTHFKRKRKPYRSLPPLSTLILVKPCALFYDNNFPIKARLGLVCLNVKTKIIWNCSWDWRVVWTNQLGKYKVAVRKVRKLGPVYVYMIEYRGGLDRIKLDMLVGTSLFCPELSAVTFRIPLAAIETRKLELKDVLKMQINAQSRKHTIRGGTKFVTLTLILKRLPVTKDTCLGDEVAEVQDLLNKQVEYWMNWRRRSLLSRSLKIPILADADVMTDVSNPGRCHVPVILHPASLNIAQMLSKLSGTKCPTSETDLLKWANTTTQKHEPCVKPDSIIQGLINHYRDTPMCQTPAHESLNTSLAPHGHLANAFIDLLLEIFEGETHNRGRPKMYSASNFERTGGLTRSVQAQE
ncbi:hypothetical protein BU17DRAFT_61803 [Hysterangium stoloniferum]|nr:hypothetical protein BU17DRAFT_61803 [Hysterangium stoloniferum]